MRFLLFGGALALGACARDNPAFGDDGDTDSVQTQASGVTASGPNSASGSASNSGGSTTSPGTTSTDPESTGGESDPTLAETGHDTGSSTGVAEQCLDPGAVKLPEATADEDAFLVNASSCAEIGEGCPTQNFGGSGVHDLFADGESFEAFYVARLSPLPAEPLFAATLQLGIQFGTEDVAGELFVAGFISDCAWIAGTGTGSGTPADGITYEACNANSPFDGGTPSPAIGERLGAVDLIGLEEGDGSLQIPLDLGAVDRWLAQSDSVIIGVTGVPPELLHVRALEAKNSGAATIRFLGCE